MRKRTIVVAATLGLLVLALWLRGPWVPVAFSPDIRIGVPMICQASASDRVLTCHAWRPRSAQPSGTPR